MKNPGEIVPVLESILTVTLEAKVDIFCEERNL